MDARSPRPALNQARAQRSRAALVAAVRRIVAAEGEEAVTTTRVAAEAGLSVGAVYRYFKDREDLLLAAYDATVDTLVGACHAAFEALPPDIAAPMAARRLLDAYLAAAAAEPAHAPLLRAMRRMRPVEADQGANEDGVVAGVLRPFMLRFAPQAAAAPARLHLISVLIGTLVDLCLVAEDDADRALLRAETEAHLLLALDRAIG